MAGGNQVAGQFHFFGKMGQVGGEQIDEQCLLGWVLFTVDKRRALFRRHLATGVNGGINRVEVALGHAAHGLEIGGATGIAAGNLDQQIITQDRACRAVGIGGRLFTPVENLP